MTGIAIEIEDMYKTYRGSETPALRGINLKISVGEKIGLVGANGSGKTTLLRLIMNYLSPDSGKIRILGNPDPESNKNHLGYIGELQEGLENFTPRELLRLAGRMYGFRRPEREKRVTELIKFMKLQEVQNDLLEGFSKGMRQRVFLSLALFHRPKILLLDEPLSGLDAEGKESIRNLFAQLDTETIVFASHQLEDIEDFSTRVIFLHQGEIAAEVRQEEMSRDIFTLEGPPQMEKILTDHLNLSISNIQQRGTQIRVQMVLEPQQLKYILDELKKHDIALRRIRSQSILTELYQQYVKQSL